MAQPPFANASQHEACRHTFGWANLAAYDCIREDLADFDFNDEITTPMKDNSQYSSKGVQWKETECSDLYDVIY